LLLYLSCLDDWIHIVAVDLGLHRDASIHARYLSCVEEPAGRQPSPLPPAGEIGRAAAACTLYYLAPAGHASTWNRLHLTRSPSARTPPVPARPPRWRIGSQSQALAPRLARLREHQHQPVNRNSSARPRTARQTPATATRRDSDSNGPRPARAGLGFGHGRMCRADRPPERAGSHAWSGRARPKYYCTATLRGSRVGAHVRAVRAGARAERSPRVRARRRRWTGERERESRTPRGGFPWSPRPGARPALVRPCYSHCSIVAVSKDRLADQ
jgi:hypothetical protein